MVRRSHTATDSSTVLVWEVMLGLMNIIVNIRWIIVMAVLSKPNLLRTMMMPVLKIKVMHMRTGMMKP